MKNIKKISFLAITIVLGMVLTACGSYTPYDYDLGKYITLGEYEGLYYEYSDIEVTDSDVTQAINSQLRASGYGQAQTITSGEILYGDIVTMNFIGSVDSQLVSELGGNDYKLEIGTGTFLDDFELGLIGNTIGKNFSLEIVFPIDYIKIAYAGKTVVYDIVVTSVSRMGYPELTDTIVADISDYATVDEYTAAERAELEQKFLQLADEEREEALWEQVVANATVSSYPEKATKYLTETYQEQFTEQAENNDMTVSEYLEENNLSWDEINAYIDNNVKATCKDEMVMYSIARTEGLTVSEQEIEQLAESYVETYKYDSVKQLYKEYGKELIKQTLLYQKVKDFIVENAAV